MNLSITLLTLTVKVRWRIIIKQRTKGGSRVKERGKYNKTELGHEARIVREKQKNNDKESHKKGGKQMYTWRHSCIKCMNYTRNYNFMSTHTYTYKLAETWSIYTELSQTHKHPPRNPRQTHRHAYSDLNTHRETHHNIQAKTQTLKEYTQIYRQKKRIHARTRKHTYEHALTISSITSGWWVSPPAGGVCLRGRLVPCDATRLGVAMP